MSDLRVEDQKACEDEVVKFAENGVNQPYRPAV